MEIEVSTETQTRQLVAFRLDEAAYGFAIERVREILQMVEITPVPDAPVQVRGAINVRGAVVPILDLRTILGLADRPYDAGTPIILVESSGRLVGLAVDDVSDVVTVEEDCVDTATKDYPLGGRLAAVCKLKDEMLFVLDPERLVVGDLPDLAGGEEE